MGNVDLQFFFVGFIVPIFFVFILTLEGLKYLMESRNKETFFQKMTHFAPSPLTNGQEKVLGYAYLVTALIFLVIIVFGYNTFK
ncbi:MAG: hypothetical protein M1150_03460 [Patescibacteria group bacterium]|nr:hypothetical protein [Patescibacteria group bacterium]